MQTRSSSAFNGGVRSVVGKRKADESGLSSDNIGDNERFIAKRLHSLSIGSSGLDGDHHVPIASKVTEPHAPTPATDHQDEHMQVDDTRDRVYIHDIDLELADIVEEEQKLIFLPDIEKHLSRLPQQVLNGLREDESENQELVLYDVPRSLTVDEEHDSVRKAILEARQRARDKAAQEARQADMERKYADSGGAIEAETAHGYGTGYAEELDPDAMDLE